MNRALRIRSKPDLLSDEFKYIRTTANFNSYPAKFVQQIIEKQSEKLKQPKEQQNQIQQPSNENKKIQVH